MTLKESSAIIGGDPLPERKAVCDLLQQEIDHEISFYDRELEQLQARRAAMWDAHSELQMYLLEQEKNRNEKLDVIYQTHTGVLEKIYIRHNDNVEHVAKDTIDAGTKSFKYLLGPLQLFLQYFRLSSGIAPDRAAGERASRENVADIERDINKDATNNGRDELIDERDEIEDSAVDLTT